MAVGGDGPWAMALMWAFVAVTFVFVVLRLYTRVVLVDKYAIDDHVYNIAFVFLLLYTAFLQVSAHYGFGQRMDEIQNPHDISAAILNEAIGQIFAVIGMALAKWSLGFFLLRIVHDRRQRYLVIASMAMLMCASISTVLVFMLQCTPPAYLWDRAIPGGYCHIDTTGVALTLCVLCIFCDFAFAILPWFFIWKLHMNKREKIVILVSLSFGFIAGACGIKRSLEVPSLAHTQNYLKDTVGLITWSAAEMALTLVCIGIPVLRPLYRRFIDKLTSRDSASGGYRKQSRGGGSNSNSGSRPHYALRTFGGSRMPHSGAVASRAHPNGTLVGNEGADSGSDRDLGVGGNRIYVATDTWVTSTNRSNEEILGDKV